MNKEQEIKIFRAICGEEKILTSQHQNTFNEHSEYAGNFNQGVCKVKLKEYIEKGGLDFEYWENL